MKQKLQWKIRKTQTETKTGKLILKLNVN